MTTGVQDTLSGGAEAKGRGRSIAKTSTGVTGFDAITGGGLPAGRTTAVIGQAGAGKTVFALQTLAHRIKLAGEGCIFVSFEEAPDRLLANAASLDWGADLNGNPKFSLVDARVPQEAVIAGAFDLSALLSTLKAVSEDLGAAFIVFDGIDRLLDCLWEERLERQELNRLDRWIQASGLTAIIAVKDFDGGDRDQRRSDFIEYMTDCVIVLKCWVTETGASRTLRVSKFRGSEFAGNPAPVVITRAGYEVFADDYSRSDYPTFTERLPSGIPRLDGLLAGGYLRGSSVLISGSPGTSKTSLAASFAAAACAASRKALFISFDESGAQIVSNMRSIGLELQPDIDAGRLQFKSLISGRRSPEAYLAEIRAWMDSFAPDVQIIDPISALMNGEFPFSHFICAGLMNYAKSKGVTVLCTSLLSHADGAQELSASQISTIADTWMHVSNVIRDGERNRALTIIKSRGAAHSNQVRELILSHHGIELMDAYVVEGEVLMGSARAQKEAEIMRGETRRDLEARLRRMDLERQIDVLAQAVRSAEAALELKTRESEAVRSAEETLWQSRQAEIAQRRGRRSGDRAERSDSNGAGIA